MQQSSVMETFAKNVRKCLRAYGWTVRDLCAASGLHEAGMGRILNGKEGCTLQRAAVIAEALEVELADLLSENFEIEPAVA